MQFSEFPSTLNPPAIHFPRIHPPNLYTHFIEGHSLGRTLTLSSGSPQNSVGLISVYPINWLTLCSFQSFPQPLTLRQSISPEFTPESLHPFHRGVPLARRTLIPSSGSPQNWAMQAQIYMFGQYIRIGPMQISGTYVCPELSPLARSIYRASFLERFARPRFGFRPQFAPPQFLLGCTSYKWLE